MTHRQESQMPSNIYDIGWWIESADDDVYGPVSRATLQRFLEQGVISPNTLVRHCTEAATRPVADVPGVRQGVKAGVALLPHGDRLAETWPRSKKERRALAEDTVPCAWKKQPAVLVCLRCGAPYCEKYRMKPFKRQYYFCRRCQARVYNRRALAYMFDLFVLYMGILVLAGALGAVTAVAGLPQSTAVAVIYGVTFLLLIVFVFRDRLLANAGPGKRLLGLRVVHASDGVTSISYGQAFIRFLSLQIPIFQLVDLSVPYRDPLTRRYGDRWAKTRVIDTEAKLAKDRARMATRLAKKQISLENPVKTPLSEFARIAG
jgi:uncharacterized RDD family membrane protein YckC